MITGLRPKTFENLQTNAGAFLKTFDWRKYKTLEELETAVIEALDDIKHLIGATIGGGSFQCTPSIRNREADGMRYPIVGSTVNSFLDAFNAKSLIFIRTPSFYCFPA